MIWFSFLCQALALSLNAPPGFRVTKWADVPGARSLARSGDSIFVGTGGFFHPLDRVYRVRDWNQDGKIGSDEVEILIEGLSNPNGVAIRKNDLYVAERTRILRFADAVNLPRGKKLKIENAVEQPITLPSESQHGWRYIRFAPGVDDPWLYVSVGAPCNVCLPPTPLHAAIHRLNVESGKWETVARGVRNSVGFAFHPKTGKLWFTDNGRDLLGDDVPGDELNELAKPGDHFGYPFCYGQRVRDSEIKDLKEIKSCAQTKAPVRELGAHVAALGLRFASDSKFPAGFRNRIFIAEHGSWNRSQKSGYRVTMVDPTAATPTYEPFISGWLDEKTQKAWGRPVDLEFMADGSMILSDDGFSSGENAGTLYRVEYKGR